MAQARRHDRVSATDRQIDKILRRRSHYREVFKAGASADAVLADLQRFCFGNAPTIIYGAQGSVDPLASIAAAARQEVWLRIINHLRIDDAQLLKLKEEATYHDD
jgi:hypothetical protein